MLDHAKVRQRNLGWMKTAYDKHRQRLAAGGESLGGGNAGSRKARAEPKKASDRGRGEKSKRKGTSNRGPMDAFVSRAESTGKMKEKRRRLS